MECYIEYYMFRDIFDGMDHVPWGVPFSMDISMFHGIEFSIEHSMEYSIECSMKCSIECSQFSMICSMEFSMFQGMLHVMFQGIFYEMFLLLCSKECSVEYSRIYLKWFP